MLEIKNQHLCLEDIVGWPTVGGISLLDKY